MKVVILAGGHGSRLSEETHLKPKPMVEVGGKPILWHILKIYSHYGFNEFVICLGYKGYLIKEYFANYFLFQCNVTIDLKENSIEVHEKNVEPWKITLVDTGLETQTGGRLKRVQPYVGDQTFMMTYGDGVGDIDVSALVRCHRGHGKLATVTATQPAGRFGALSLDENDGVTDFHEKPIGDGAWINGGFFVLEPGVFDYIDGDESIFERAPINAITRDGQLVAHRHRGFWKPMDTLRDRNQLDTLWECGRAPWKLWD